MTDSKFVKVGIIGIGTIGSAHAAAIYGGLIDGMKQLANGDYSARMSIGKPFGEMSVLRAVSDSFNTMAEELENTEVLRSDFINNFSHEFKTPIVSIAGFAKLLKRGDLSDRLVLLALSILRDQFARL